MVYLHLCQHHVLAAFSEWEPSCLLHTYSFFLIQVLVLHMPFLFFCDNVNFVYETPVANLCSFPCWIRLYSFTILLQDYSLIPDLVCWLEYVNSSVTLLYIRDL